MLRIGGRYRIARVAVERLIDGQLSSSRVGRTAAFASVFNWGLRSEPQRRAPRCPYRTNPALAENAADVGLLSRPLR
jgi:hypothetical protein